MRAAISLAKRGRNKVHPNPMVGALIVKEGAIISSDYHRKAGGDHAEIRAIKRAGGSLDGSVMYVNLEPCCHHGKTPPCTEAIIKSGISKVVAGTIDPNPLVSGRGVAILRAAGVEVETGVLESECRELNEIFFTNMEKGRPFVTLKLAATLDGKIADRERQSRWITSQSARNEVHRLRSKNDSVVVGLGTVQADDPLLLPVGIKSHRKPVRIVLDPMLEMSPESKLAKTAKESRVIVFTSENAPPEREARLVSASVEIVRMASRGDFLVLPDVMRKILDMGMTSILCEGGSTLAASLLKDNLVDRLIFFTAPVVLGDPLAIPAFADTGVRRLDGLLRFETQKIKRMEDDIMLILKPAAGR